MIVHHTRASALLTKMCDNKNETGLCAGHDLSLSPPEFPPADFPEEPITPERAFELLPWCRVAMAALHGQQRTIRAEIERQQAGGA